MHLPLIEYYSSVNRAWRKKSGTSAASLFQFSTRRSFPPEAQETRRRRKKRRPDISGGLSRRAGKNPAGKPVGETSDTTVININRINPDAFTWQAVVSTRFSHDLVKATSRFLAAFSQKNTQSMREIIFSRKRVAGLTN